MLGWILRQRKRAIPPSSSIWHQPISWPTLATHAAQPTQQQHQPASLLETLVWYGWRHPQHIRQQHSQSLALAHVAHAAALHKPSIRTCPAALLRCVQRDADDCTSVQLACWAAAGGIAHPRTMALIEAAASQHTEIRGPLVDPAYVSQQLHTLSYSHASLRRWPAFHRLLRHLTVQHADHCNLLTACFFLEAWARLGGAGTEVVGALWGSVMQIVKGGCVPGGDEQQQRRQHPIGGRKSRDNKGTTNIFRNFARCLSALSRIPHSTATPWTPTDADLAICGTWLQARLPVVDDPVALATLLVALSRMQKLPDTLDITHVARRFFDLHHMWEPRSTANVMHSLAKLYEARLLSQRRAMRHIDWAAFGPAVNPHIPRMDAQALCNILWALATLRLDPVNHVGLDVAAYGRMVNRVVNECAPQGLANTLWALYRMQIDPVADMGLDLRAYGRVVNALVKRCSSQELVTLVWAMAGLQIDPVADMGLDLKGYGRAVSSKLQHHAMRMQALANCLLALARMGVDPVHDMGLDLSLLGAAVNRKLHSNSGGGGGGVDDDEQQQCAVGGTSAAHHSSGGRATQQQAHQPCSSSHVPHVPHVPLVSERDIIILFTALHRLHLHPVTDLGLDVAACGAAISSLLPTMGAANVCSLLSMLADWAPQGGGGGRHVRGDGAPAGAEGPIQATEGQGLQQSTAHNTPVSLLHHLDLPAYGAALHAALPSSSTHAHIDALWAMARLGIHPVVDMHLDLAHYGRVLEANLHYASLHHVAIMLLAAASLGVHLEEDLCFSDLLSVGRTINVRLPSSTPHDVTTLVLALMQLEGGVVGRMGVDVQGVRGRVCQLGGGLDGRALSTMLWAMRGGGGGDGGGGGGEDKEDKGWGMRHVLFRGAPIQRLVHTLVHRLSHPTTHPDPPAPHDIINALHACVSLRHRPSAHDMHTLTTAIVALPDAQRAVVAADVLWTCFLLQRRPSHDVVRVLVHDAVQQQQGEEVVHEVGMGGMPRSLVQSVLAVVGMLAYTEGHQGTEGHQYTEGQHEYNGQHQYTEGHHQYEGVMDIIPILREAVATCMCNTTTTNNSSCSSAQQHYSNAQQLLLAHQACLAMGVEGGLLPDDHLHVLQHDVLQQAWSTHEQQAWSTHEQHPWSTHEQHHAPEMCSSSSSRGSNSSTSSGRHAATAARHGQKSTAHAHGSAARHYSCTIPPTPPIQTPTPTPTPSSKLATRSKFAARLQELGAFAHIQTGAPVLNNTCMVDALCTATDGRVVAVDVVGARRGFGNQPDVVDGLLALKHALLRAQGVQVLTVDRKMLRGGRGEGRVRGGGEEM